MVDVHLAVLLQVQQEESVMHTFNTKSGRQIQYNSDRSGNAQIVMLDGERVQLPCEELIDFVAMLVRRDRIAALEQIEDDKRKIEALEAQSSGEILGLRW